MTRGRAFWIPAFAGMTLVFLATFFPIISYAEEKPVTAIAMHGEPKYAAGFTHFDYANADAPKGGALKLGILGTFDSLNPFIVRGNVPLGFSAARAPYMALVYESLMARSADEPFSLYGLIAQTAQMPEDRSSITFNLDPRARWSDGQPITADDVLFSWQALRDKGRPNHRIYYKKVAKAEKLGPLKVKFTFAPEANGAINREMPLIIALMPVLPKHEWDGRDFAATSLRIPVGSGPYKITAVDAGRSITFMRDADYWAKDIPSRRGLYNFDSIRVDYYRDAAIALQAFRAGAYDFRAEDNVNRWATSYDFPAAHDGRVTLTTLPHHGAEPMEGFTLNTRRAPFNDPVLRAALDYTFDSGWINRNLFHGLYRRTASFFPNSELAAPPLPEGREREILDTYKAQLPSDIFSEPVAPPETDGSEANLRDNLLKADTLLRNAGYVTKDGALYAPGSDKPVSFEILLSDPAQEKIALTWSRALKRIGIAARVHTVDSAQFQSRIAGFDYDVTVVKWFNSLSPGNEQIYYWGSAAAAQPGSRNYPGVNDPVVDALAASIPAARTRDELVAATHALDRILMRGHYVIPFFYSGADMIGYAARLHHGDAPPPYGTSLESWWIQ